MSKKIDSTLTDLIKALSKHGEVVGGHHVSAKQALRATAKVQSAVAAYSAAVEARSQPNPFSALANPGLDEDTIHSLEAERDSIKDDVAEDAAHHPGSADTPEFSDAPASPQDGAAAGESGR
jgi:hypothetical protein